jgi:hypothetical protein
MFRMAMLAATLALAISALVIPAAQGKPLAPATLPGEHGQVVPSSANAAQVRPDVGSSFAYGIGNAAIWTKQLARPDDRGYVQGVGNASTTGPRPDDRGFAQGIGSAAAGDTSSGSSYDWTTLLAAIGLGLGLFALVAGGVMTSLRRQDEKLAV